MEEKTTQANNERKLCKQRAKGVLKKHYLLLVVLCVISIAFGTEYSYVVPSVENLYKGVTGQQIELGGDLLKLNGDKTRDKILDDFINDNINAGREKAAEQLQAYKEAKLSNEVMGRQSGVFAAVANTISSGQFYIVLFNGLHSIVHSSRVSSAVVVALSILFSAFIWIFLKNMYTAVMRRMFLEARTYESVPPAHALFFKFVGRWARVSMTMLLRSLYQLLWGLTVVGLVIKHYSYFLVPYIVAENPDIKPNEAITLSRKMMDGHKLECFKMELSFVGWSILGVLTFGTVEVLWTLPYMTATFAEYYVARREEAKALGIDGAEMLNDQYLYEKAEESLLRKTYSDVEEAKKYIDDNRVTLTGKRAFFAKNFGLWIGDLKLKKQYDEVDNRRKQIVEDRAVIKGKIYPQRLYPIWDPKHNQTVGKLRALRTYSIWSIIMVFFAFAFVGWLWEVSLHIVNDGTFVNRGVLHGPWLPIYGGGVSLIVVFLAKWRNKPYAEAIGIVLLCGVVEYTTSWVLEMVAGMRWWDYTGYYLNLNGRICGEGLMIFALGGMMAVYFLVPIIDAMLSRVKPKILVPIAIILSVLFISDLAYSIMVPNVGEGITDYEAYQEVD